MPLITLEYEQKTVVIDSTKLPKVPAGATDTYAFLRSNKGETIFTSEHLDVRLGHYKAVLALIASDLEQRINTVTNNVYKDFLQALLEDFNRQKEALQRGTSIANLLELAKAMHDMLFAQNIEPASEPCVTQLIELKLTAALSNYTLTRSSQMFLMNAAQQVLAAKVTTLLDGTKLEQLPAGLQTKIQQASALKKMTDIVQQFQVNQNALNNDASVTDSIAAELQGWKVQRAARRQSLEGALVELNQLQQQLDSVTVPDNNNYRGRAHVLCNKLINEAISAIQTVNDDVDTRFEAAKKAYAEYEKAIAKMPAESSLLINKELKNKLEGIAKSAAESDPPLASACQNLADQIEQKTALLSNFVSFGIPAFFHDTAGHVNKTYTTLKAFEKYAARALAYHELLLLSQPAVVALAPVVVAPPVVVVPPKPAAATPIAVTINVTAGSDLNQLLKEKAEEQAQAFYKAKRAKSKKNDVQFAEYFAKAKWTINSDANSSSENQQFIAALNVAIERLQSTCVATATSQETPVAVVEGGLPSVGVASSSSTNLVIARNEVLCPSGTTQPKGIL